MVGSEASMTVNEKNMNRICEDCHIQPIAYFNKSGFCGLCRGRNFHKTARGKAKKMAYYYKRRNEDGKTLTLCGHAICEAQKRKTKAHPSETYILYNKCMRCDVLWDKSVIRCPHCKYPVRMKPRNKRFNKKLVGLADKSY